MRIKLYTTHIYDINIRTMIDERRMDKWIQKLGDDNKTTESKQKKN